MEDRMAHRGRGTGVPPVEEALEAEVLCPMHEYISQIQSTIEESITTRTIYEMCTGAQRLQGTSRMVWWWVQEHNWEEGDNGVRGQEAGKVE